MAYKDEYEVARLYTNGDFKEKLSNAFEGKLKLKFHVAPPLFAPKDPNTGKLKKITLGSWILPIFKVLSKLKFLRGTILDPFGKTKERKMERLLINQYKKDLTKILNELDTKNISLAVQIASIPEMIRGYGHVKEENMKKAEQKRKELLEIWNSKEYISARSEFSDKSEIHKNTICNVCKNQTHSKRLSRVSKSFAIKL